MKKIEYEKPELKELDTERGEGFCDGGYADADICSNGSFADNLCANGASN